MDLVLVFYRPIATFPSNICWRGGLFSIICFWQLCQILCEYSCMDSCLGPLFCSTGLHVCFCASTMLFSYNFKIISLLNQLFTQPITSFGVAETTALRFTNIKKSWNLFFLINCFTRTSDLPMTAQKVLDLEERHCVDYRNNQKCFGQFFFIQLSWPIRKPHEFFQFFRFLEFYVLNDWSY
jgi:hypothetical protein